MPVVLNKIENILFQVKLASKATFSTQKQTPYHFKNRARDFYAYIMRDKVPFINILHI